ncbi:hypothetical protein B9479_006060 [Cryptococcus floricola]|uniref:Uncharacterized protein n=1 Tax=Cryptococcus floricola TaxID=2591691 RepID=A0A5D3AU42_9TREE|nr:hypothetical protein B9479_006060 [Cryptococcus floricola]
MSLPFAPTPITPTPMGRPLDPRLYSTGHITRTPVGGVTPLAPIRIPMWNLRAPAPVTPTGRAEEQDVAEDTQVARPPRSPETLRRYRLAAMVARMGERMGLCRRCRQKGLACVSIEGVTKCSACTRVGYISLFRSLSEGPGSVPNAPFSILFATFARGGSGGANPAFAKHSPQAAFGGDGRAHGREDGSVTPLPTEGAGVRVDRGCHEVLGVHPSGLQLLPRPVVTNFIVDLLAVAGLAPSAKRAITQALTAD